jgi:hypothetical protein
LAALSTGSAQACFCVRRSDSAQVSLWAVLYGSVVESRDAGSTRFHQTEMVWPAAGVQPPCA